MNTSRMFWGGLVAALAVAVVVLASVLGLYIVPAKSVVQSSVVWHTGNGAWNGSVPADSIIQSPRFNTCPPADVVGNGTLSFVWNSNATDTNGALAANYGFPIRLVVLYGINATRGGYSLSVGPQSPVCQGDWFVGFDNSVPYTVSWSLAFFYNYTTTTPIL